MAPALLRQIWVLSRKNLIIVLRRHYFSTLVRAFWLPVIFVAFLSFSRYFPVPPGLYGIGTPAPIRTLGDALARMPSKKLVFVNNGLGGEVDELIARMENQLKGRGKVVILDDEIQLRKECKQNLRGFSNCFAAVIFENSPKTNKQWKYTLRGDVNLSRGKVNVDSHDNSLQKIVLPLQLAVDREIAKTEGDSSADNARVEEYIYTDISDKEYQQKLRRMFSSAMMNALSVAYLIGMIGIVYHLTGFQAMEREKGLSTLIEAMGGSKFARMMSYHASFSAVYIIGWVVVSINIWVGIFNNSSPIVLIIWHLTSGWALASWALLLGSIFKRAQLSGISATVFSLGLGVIAQVSKNSSTGTYAILSLLFPPCNYVFHSISLARWEGKQMGASIIKGAPAGNSSLPIVAFWIFSIAQAVIFMVGAAYVEHFLYGTTSLGHRHINSGNMTPGNAVELRGFTKRYPPRLLTRLFGRSTNKEAVVAVNNLDLDVLEGQILVLLGANGSGKTTTLEAIAGLSSVKEGNISISNPGSGGIGICPQKNVLWDEMTVEEHVRIWSLLKCPGGSDKATILQLIEQCDLTSKRDTRSRQLSGGQMRKLQLAIMFTGDTTICAIDEVSSGLDPLSRRKIWDIILAARGQKTILMTSHFLDEADLLADQIAILSKGHLKCEGSAVQLKTEYGSGYRVYAPIHAPDFVGVSMKRSYDQTVYNVPGANDAHRLIQALAKSGVSDYYVQGPTIEDVFLSVAEENFALSPEQMREKLATTETVDQISSCSDSPIEEKSSVDLHAGRPISILRQTWVLIRKRITILQRSYLPSVVAIVIPIVTAGFTMLTFKNYPDKVMCNQATHISESNIMNFTHRPDYRLVLGPRDEFNPLTLLGLANILLPNGTGSEAIGTNLNLNLSDSITFVNTLGEFNQYITDNYKNVTPGGVFFSGKDEATVAFQTYGAPRGSMTLQNAVDNLMFNVPGGISAQYLPFDYIWPTGQRDTLWFVSYTSLAFATFPAFFALYPTIERVRKVRGLQYSNGVRALPLWLAHSLFEFPSVLLISVVCTGIFAAATSGWYHLGYLFVVVLLYGIASTQLGFCISLITKSQLSAFAFSAGSQAVMYLVYIMTYMCIYTFVEPANLDNALQIANTVLCAISPVSCLVHGFFVSLNSFSIDCVDETISGDPDAYRLYGSSIIFLTVHIILFFSILILHDSGKLRFAFCFPSRMFQKISPTAGDPEDNTFSEQDIIAETRRVETATAGGLRVLHLSKQFKKLQVVDDVSFGVPSGEVFALLGPNGAGKTTTINMVRGDLPASGGQIFVQDVLVNQNRSAARKHLGVCPQHDAIDRMSVTEHLEFYARIRGVEDVAYNVDEVIHAVGLQAFRHRAAEQLSGGNKRKLSLGIALMGNPAVLLLDEPSSGMDAAAKRVMWRTIETVKAGRSVVLTTHSMEECSALAGRAGILAKRMLALGTTEELRKRFGDSYLVHLVLASAPHSAEEEMENVKNWALASFPGAEIERRSFGGQIRLKIPAYVSTNGSREELDDDDEEEEGVGRVFAQLGKEGPAMGLRFWSMDRGTMDMVFLEVVGRANIREEGYEEAGSKRIWKMVAMAVFCPWMFLIR